MDSWWQLGEGSGRRGAELAIYDITCPFFLERGNFAFAYQASKKKPNSSKVLHFDTLKCGNCAGYVMVLWSVGEFMIHDPLHRFFVLPWPLTLDEYPKHWPKPVGRFWLQAHRSARDANWDAAAMTARSALQQVLRGQGAKGQNLKQEIDDLAKKGILPPHMKEWAHELRELGNDSAHPDPDAGGAAAKDVREVIKFLDFLLKYLLDLPHEIAEYRERRT